MKKFVIAIIMVGLLAGNAMAIDWAFAPHVFDQEIFDYNNDWSPISYPGLPPNTPSPGGADGEMFDIEGAKFGMDADYLYFAVTTSHNFGAWWNGIFYEAGDFFFDLVGAKGSLSFAVDYTDGYVYFNDMAPFGIPDIPGGYYNNAAINAACGAFAVNTKSLYLGMAGGYMHTATENNPDDTFVLELAISKSFFDVYFDIDFNNLWSVRAHQTVACGNDVLDKDFQVIPEPGTLALLGMGLLGTGLLFRRRK